MNIVLITHPEFLKSQSMPRYAAWLQNGLRQKGHNVQSISPTPFFYKLPTNSSLKKWMGYIDQYLLFPRKLRRVVRKNKDSTLYVFTDHALGPWVPIASGKPHVIHCHDFLAQKSALGEIPEHVTKYTGRIYQQYIRNGYKKGKNFISTSHATQIDLLRMINKKEYFSTVVYNALTRQFESQRDQLALRYELTRETGIALHDGFILHVGGNQWYKNRVGVVKAFDFWKSQSGKSLPLLLVGTSPSAELKMAIDAAENKHDIHVLTGQSDSFVTRCYAAASLLLFPSLAEGFGWPIAEAMASGCPVITTNLAPMNEVGGQAAFYISKMPSSGSNASWLNEVAATIDRIDELDETTRNNIRDKGIREVKRFESEPIMEEIERVYLKVYENSFNN